MSLTHCELKKLLWYDQSTGRFRTRVDLGTRHPPWSLIGSRKNRQYEVVGLLGRQYRTHRLAWFYVHGVWPTGVVDHRDRDPHNNRIENLRDVPRVVNNQNQKPAGRRSRSKLLGVRPTPTGRFAAKIVANGVVHCLGTFDNPEAAHEVYLSAKKKLHEGYVP